jgi:hypothetical protein
MWVSILAMVLVLNLYPPIKMLDIIFHSLAATLVQAEKLSVNPGKRTGIQYAGECRGHGSQVVGGVVLQCGIRWTTYMCDSVHVFLRQKKQASSISV